MNIKAFSVFSMIFGCMVNSVAFADSCSKLAGNWECTFPNSDASFVIALRDLNSNGIDWKVATSFGGQQIPKDSETLGWETHHVTDQWYPLGTNLIAYASCLDSQDLRVYRAIKENPTEAVLWRYLIKTDGTLTFSVTFKGYENEPTVGNHYTGCTRL